MTGKCSRCSGSTSGKMCLIKGATNETICEDCILDHEWKMKTAEMDIHGNIHVSQPKITDDMP